MQKWEYMSIIENQEKNESYLNYCEVPGELIVRTYKSAFIGTLFNEVGNEGWEMVGFIERHIPYTRINADSPEDRVVEYWFKKPLVEDDSEQA